MSVFSQVQTNDVCRFRSNSTMCFGHLHLVMLTSLINTNVKLQNMVVHHLASLKVYLCSLRYLRPLLTDCLSFIFVLEYHDGRVFGLCDN